MAYKFKFGDEVEDKITGFVGVVTGASSYITGCDQILVQPRVDKEVKKVDAEWFDDGRLKKLRKKKLSAKSVKKDGDPPGACGVAPVK